MKDSRFLSVFDLLLLPINGACEGDGGEFGPRGQQRQAVHSKRRHFNNQDKISVATWRIVNGRHGTLAHIQGKHPRTINRNSQEEDPSTW